MNITVVDPQNSSGFVWDVSLINAYLYSFFKKQNCGVDFVECDKIIPYGEVKEGTFGQEEYLDKILSEITNKSPDIILFNHKTFSLPFIFKAAGAVKKLDSSVITALGGLNQDLTESIAAGEGPIDYLLAGDIETTLDVFLKDIKSLSAEKRVYNCGETANLDCITPDFSFYNSEEVRYIPYDISRGCRFNCAFCSRGGKKIRRKSIKKAVADIKEFARKYNAERFAFTDDYFNHDLKFLRELFLEINKSGINFKFMCSWVLDKEIDMDFIKFLKDSGLTYLILSAESFPGRVYADKRFYDKKYLFKYLRETVIKIKQAGINAVVNLLANSYDDTEESFECIEEFVRDMKGQIELCVETVLILPGSGLWQKHKRGEIETLLRNEADMPQIKKSPFSGDFKENILFSPQYSMIKNDCINANIKKMLRVENWSYDYKNIARKKYTYEVGDKSTKLDIELQDCIDQITVRAAAKKAAVHKDFYLKISQNVLINLNHNIAGSFNLEEGLIFKTYKINLEKIIEPGKYAVEFASKDDNFFIDWIEFQSSIW